MKVIVLCLALFAAPAFAGRAFPVDSENFVVELFARANRRIEWDPANYLVDLSGRYCLCKHMGINGHITVEEKTPEGYTIGGISATYAGGASDADSVKSYIKDVMPSWLETRSFIEQIERADIFGCSVQPSCKGNFVITCLFSPEYRGGQPTERPPQDIIGQPKAQAFTPEQYMVAEAVFGRNWDRSHLLENLSGQETDCAMLVNNEWSFPIARQVAEQRGLIIEPLYAAALNRGATEPAMVEVLESWKPVFSKFQSGSIGCSLIPSCRDQGNMFVVVSCIISI